MKVFLVSFACFLFSSGLYAQQLSQVSFLNGANLTHFSVRTDQDVLIHLSDDGKILEWGTEVLAKQGNYYAPKLQPFLARTDYYDAYADSAFRGKVKSIGTCYISYYGSYDEEHKRGRVKSMGPLLFDYYSRHDEKTLQGKLKNVGNLMLEYYRPYEHDSIRGKLKSIGSTVITYYSVFDDKYNAGKLKSIGPVPYKWYSPLNNIYNRGGLLTNNYRQLIGGVLFVLR
jgi:hypothetical protein